MKFRKYIIGSCAILFLFACKKKTTINYAPVIAFVSVSPGTVKEFQDSLKFTISYTDEDGDLGENNANAENLFVTDNRVNIVYKYRINQLAPAGSKISIKGNLDVVLKSTEITDGSSRQTATYSIYVTDRAGNKSNVVTSSAITVTK